MESGFYMANPQPVGGETVQGGLTTQKEYQTIGTMTEANELVRDIPKKELASECDNFLIGWSIIGKLEMDKSITINCTIHAYRGSTTNKKIQVLNKYDPKKFELE